MLLNQKKGLSLLGMLITLIIIMVLISIMLPKYQKTVTTQHSQQKQTIDNVRKTLKQAENAAAKRAEGLPENF